MIRQTPLCVGLLALLSLTSCGTQTEDVLAFDEGSPSTVEIALSPNKALLDEVSEEGLWLHAKKTRAIWARRVEEDQTLTTLEGVETVKAGDYLCRGEVGELWPQKEEKLLAKYQATEDVDEEGWRQYIPNPDASGVMAAQIAYSFTIEATWGTLHGKPGDFVVKSFDDRDVAYPEDVWIVDQALFRATYAEVESRRAAAA